MILFRILPQHHGQNSTERPWSEATLRYTSVLGSYPRDRRPNTATVVLHDPEVFRSNERGWDQNDWTRALNGKFGETIEAGCRKVEGLLHERASFIAVAGNLLEPDATSSPHPNITAQLCPATGRTCDKQIPFLAVLPPEIRR